MTKKENKLVLLIALMMFLFYPGFSKKPDFRNVIIIAVDTLRADHIGCCGYPVNTTPAIDEFAKDGILFTRAYAPTPLTGPSFSTMMTSLPPYKHGAKRNGMSIYKNVKTVAYYLKKFGYRTAAFISNYFLKKKLTDLDRGFDIYSEVFTRKRWMGLFTSEGPADEVNRKVFYWLEKHHKKRFFLWAHYTEPHAPYMLHDDFIMHAKGKDVNRSLYPPGTVYSKIKKYDSEIAFTDYHIGRLIAKLKGLGHYEDSLIIFVSDHGESFGEHHYFRHGRKLYNSTLHVALIVKLPGNELSGSVRRDSVSVKDLSPTIFSVLKIPVPGKMEGLPLFPEQDKRKELYFEAYKGSVVIKKKKTAHLKVEPIKYGMLKDSIKLIYNVGKKTYEAYNIKDDRFETKNLSAAQADKYPALKEMLAKYVAQVKKYIEYTAKYSKQKSNLSPEDIEQLRSLGYIDD